MSPAPGDSGCRRALRRIAAGCYAVDVRIGRLLRAWRDGASAYELRGSCRQCGACCTTPTVVLPPPMYRLRLVRRLVVAWQVHVNLFELVREDPREHALVFRCPHLDPETRRCRCYRTRPGMCRDYPRGLLLSADPRFLEGCGYYARYRNADAMREALAQENLPPDKMAELEERLHLRE